MGKMKWTLHQRGKLIDLGQVDAADERAGIKKLLEGKAWKGDGWRIKVGDSALGFDEEDVVRLTGSDMDQERPGQMEERKLSVSVPGLDVGEVLRQKELEAALDGLPRKEAPPDMLKAFQENVRKIEEDYDESLKAPFTNITVNPCLDEDVSIHKEALRRYHAREGIAPPTRKPQHGRNIHVGAGPCQHCGAERYDAHDVRCPDYGECSRCKAGMHEAHKLACPSAPKEQHDCKECGGQGSIVKRSAKGHRWEEPCPRCTPHSTTCSHCHGSGMVSYIDPNGQKMTLRCPRCTPARANLPPGYEYNPTPPNSRHHPKISRAIQHDTHNIGGPRAYPRMMSSKRDEGQMKTTYVYEVVKPDGTKETRTLVMTDQELML